jgi:arylsulfatase A-like enzyme
VRETVTLRDVAATIIDVLGLEADSPLPGSSLARFWNAKERAAKRERASSDLALAEVLPNDGRNRDSAGLPVKRWPLGAVIEQDWSYIRHEEEHREELFHLGADPREQRNLAGDPAAAPTLERMRAALDRLTAGPLVPQRFNR